jgi:hypothetical protein
MAFSREKQAGGDRLPINQKDQPEQYRPSRVKSALGVSFYKIGQAAILQS